MTFQKGELNIAKRPEVRAKMKQKAKERIAKFGNNMLGKHQTDYQKKRMHDVHSNKIVSKKTREKMSEAKLKNPTRYWSGKKRNNTWNKEKPMIKEEREKRRKKQQERILRNNGEPRLGTHEKQILDKLEQELGYKIIRQLPITGYWVDGYIPELNLVIEVDEEFHKNRKERDELRENNIQEKINCKFLRIEDRYKGGDSHERI